jgi:predicted nucleic acid-binding protein
MQDKYFIDTNIFLYSILEPKDESEQKKEKIALDFFENQSLDLVISTQVINEITNTLFRKTSLTFLVFDKVIYKLTNISYN